MAASSILFFCFMIMISLAEALSKACQDRCVHKSKAAYFATQSALSSGECGYGPLALGFNGGYIAAAVPSIYNKGAGCGAYFQIRCKNTNLCSKSGTKLVVTDVNTHNQTDFVLSSNAFVAMANRGRDHDLLKLGVADVEYKRIPCDYKNKNLSIRVEESSKKPGYLAITVLYQGGQTEILIIDVAQVGTSNWSSLSRKHRAIWDTSSVPSGNLQFRFVVMRGYDTAFYTTNQVLPENWKNGAVYDSGLQLTDIAQDGCNPCDLTN